VGKKTWTFKAQNVRDVAFASSRKFIWDGMNQPVGKHNVLCMSYYPKEGNPLWEQYSTKVVAHTIKTYSKFTCDYIYPVAHQCPYRSHRHGVSDDLLQRWSAREGRHLQ
jgi:hypothetical protein